ncbi:MAG: HAMP domain-containing protein [Deltaproteobacteria bacterium]|nr:HAMP domain-containing protein [Deltaproteobacteria bacterium]
MRFKSLQQRFTLLLVAPTALLLLALGAAGFFLARDTLLASWRESALLSLERAAHTVDMRLEAPTRLVDLVGYLFSSAFPDQDEKLLLDKIKEIPGVKDAVLSLEPASGESGPGKGSGEGWRFRGGAERSEAPVMGPVMGPGMMSSGQGWGGMMHFRRAQVARVTPPVLNAQVGERTMSLIFTLEDENKKPTGRLEVVMSFDYLLEDLKGLNFWQSQMACLVSRDGTFLAHNLRQMDHRARLGDDGDELEKEILTKMHEERSGTLLGPGYPPTMVAGFYQLKRAPWVLVLFSPAREVLAPLMAFRNWFTLAGLAGIVLVILLIRRVTSRVAGSLARVTAAAQDLAQGEYGPPLEIKGEDEPARLAQSFNRMVAGLQERDLIRETFGRYVDPAVARELLRRPEAAGRLGGSKRQVVILMTDIRGFTALCETLTPDETIVVVNEYLTALIEIIQNHGGIIVDFLGDAILAFFDPLDGSLEPLAHRAVDAALAMRQAAGAINQRLTARGLPELATGIGLHAGQVVVGNIGSRRRTKYGIVGAPVNLTSRLQAQAAGGEIVVSANLASCLDGRAVLRGPEQVELKGIAGKVTIFRLEEGDPASDTAPVCEITPPETAGPVTS